MVPVSDSYAIGLTSLATSTTMYTKYYVRVYDGYGVVFVQYLGL